MKIFHSFTRKTVIGISIIASVICLLSTGFMKEQGIIGEKTENKIKPGFEQKVDSLVKLMTLDEKLGMIHATAKFISGGVKRLGIPELTYTDGPNGIREELERDGWNSLHLTTDSMTFFPTGTALAATWNPQLAVNYGEAIGKEAKVRKKDVLLGPAVNIIRTPLSGRTFEFFTEDPFLNDCMAVGYIQGVQNRKVAACIKHYVANNQEFERDLGNAEMDDRTLHEIYLTVYKAAIEKANVLSIMGAYDKFRGDYICENSYLENTILKSQLGFKGIIVSDWGATHSSVKSALAGLDVEMGTNVSKYDSNYFGLPLKQEVLAGNVPVEVINDKVKRILRLMYSLGLMDASIQKEGNMWAESKQTAYDVASEAIVLLKNENKLLPLKKDKIKSIAIVGENAYQIQSTGGYTAGVKAKWEVSPYAGIKKAAGPSIELNYAKGYRPTYNKETDFPDDTADEDLIKEAVALASKSDAVIILAGNNRKIETEGRDRRGIKLPFGQNELIQRVVKANHNTVVVIVAGSVCDLHEVKNCAPAIVYSWFNGSEAGNALADVLFGNVNPSGKLPFTLPAKLEDVGAHFLNTYPGKNRTITYSEGILVGYRWFDTKNIEPVFPFGYGLSYSTFSYSGLTTDKPKYSKDDTIRLTLMVKNADGPAGKTTIQCYVHANNSKIFRAKQELKGFAKVWVGAGNETKLNLNIPVKDLSYYNENSKNWELEPGDYTLMVGSSSRDIYKDLIISVTN
jgi:beta-glucosidase